MGRNGFQTFGPRIEAGFAKRGVRSLSLHMAAHLRVGRELNPHGGRPDPRVKSPMLYLAELPTRLSPRQHAVLYSVLQPTFWATSRHLSNSLRPPNRDKRDCSSEPCCELRALTDR